MPKNNQTSRNHYVPQWYQKRFLPDGCAHFNYLDLHPETVVNGAARWQRRSILRWGPKKCFCENDLYTVKLGDWTTDEIEHRFFGPIDRNGERAVEFFSNYEIREGVHDAFENLIRYMDAQRIRTPRGLDWLRMAVRLSSSNARLLAMQKVYRFHATMWMEGVWEFVSASRSETKFLLTDNPITFYNVKAFPNSRDCAYPMDVPLGDIGTRTIFPLGMDHCLIISHLQLVRDPWANPRKSRVNARAYQPTMMNFMDIQHGRELEEDEVLRINLMLKQKAHRYIAAADENWLYPESRLSSTHWSRLDDDWFLFPNPYKVPFTGGIVVGYKDGSSFAMDEYGRRPHDPEYQDKKLHQREFRIAQEAKLAWALKREGRSLSQVDEDRFDDAYDRIMADDLREYREKRKGRSPHR
ncbi:MAG: DUF4238 domain-containing protein [Magnetospirillum sp.]|nr:DUF4238 domain-containing protein [Magnetospirillum sp.]